MVLNSTFTKTIYIDLPPLLLWSGFSELSEMLPPGLQSLFLPPIKLNSQLSSCTSFLLCVCVCGMCIYIYIYIYRRRKWQPTPVFLPRESHGQRSLAGYSPWGQKSWTHTYIYFLGGLHWVFDATGRLSPVAVSGGPSPTVVCWLLPWSIGPRCEGFRSGSTEAP